MQEQSPPKFVLSPEFLQAQGWSPTFLERFWDKVDKNGPLPDQTKYPGMGHCWVWTANHSKKGYGMISVGLVNKPFRAHAASWILHNGPIPEGLQCHHACDRPSCVRPDHLWIGTQQENVDDMMRKGRHIVGNIPKHENHLHAKLTWKQVEEIRALCSQGHLQCEVAKRFGLSTSNVSAIALYEIWRKQDSPNKIQGRRNGENHLSSKLTWIQVREIRKLCANGHSMLQTSKLFGVNCSTIRDIVIFKTWTHDPDLADQSRPVNGPLDGFRPHPESPDAAVPFDSETWLKL